MDVASEMILRLTSSRCPHCREAIERASGCTHMTCRCGFEYCICCGQMWVSGHMGMCTGPTAGVDGPAWPASSGSVPPPSNNVDEFKRYVEKEVGKLVTLECVVDAREALTTHCDKIRSLACHVRISWVAAYSAIAAALEDLQWHRRQPFMRECCRDSIFTAAQCLSGSEATR